MSWRPMVRTYGNSKWVGNALRFASYDEAFDNARNLFTRWTQVESYTAEQSDDPVNYRWDGTTLISVNKEDTQMSG